MSEARFELTASPHLKAPLSTARIMWTVTATLAPVVAASAWFFGPGAPLVIAAAVLGAVALEAATAGRRALADGSAVLTGVLLGLTLPAGLPLWMAFVGGAVAIGFGKAVFGGLGENVFNPALLGRAFLQAAFPAAVTTWPPVGAGAGLRGDLFAIPFTSPTSADAVTAATPLGLAKFEGATTELARLAVGDTAGSLGETSAVLVLAGGAYLAARRLLEWRIPVAIFATVAALSWLVHAVDSAAPGPLFMLLSGGLVLGAVYMATDPVTSPVTNRGAWVFGAGIGLLVVAIRVWGGLPEGVMYAILLMNAMVPFIDRATRPRVFGAREAT